MNESLMILFKQSRTRGPSMGWMLALSFLISTPGFASTLQCQNLFEKNLIGIENHSTGQHTSDLSVSEFSPNSYDALKIISHPDKPRMKLSLEDQNSISFWQDLQTYPAEKNNHIRTEASEQALSCGTCQKMLPLHLKSFVLPMMRKLGMITAEQHRRMDPSARTSSGKFVLISVKGELVGVLKLLSSQDNMISSDGTFKYDPEIELHAPIANPTFLALKNLENSQGQNVLSLGGVYYIHRQFFNDHIIPILNAQGPYINRDAPNRLVMTPKLVEFERRFRVGVLNVDHLDLTPQTFLFNSPGVDAIANQKLLEVVTPVAPTGSKRHDFSVRWKQMQKILNRARTELEMELSKDSNLTELREELAEY